MYFSYGETETAYLKHKDKKLGAVIDQLGPIHRPVDTDLFSSVVHHIIGQQISTKSPADHLEPDTAGAGRSQCGHPSDSWPGAFAELWDDFQKSGLYSGFCPESELWSV